MSTVSFTDADIDALSVARLVLHQQGCHHDALQLGDLLDRMRSERQEEIARRVEEHLSARRVRRLEAVDEATA